MCCRLCAVDRPGVCVCARQDKVLNIMTVLDAHSLKVQKKHYLLRGPEDDILLANKLVEAAPSEIPSTVLWWLGVARLLCLVSVFLSVCLAL